MPKTQLTLASSADSDKAPEAGVKMPLAGISRDARVLRNREGGLTPGGTGADTECVKDSYLQHPKGKPRGLPFAQKAYFLHLGLLFSESRFPTPGILDTRGLGHFHGRRKSQDGKHGLNL